MSSEYRVIKVRNELTLSKAATIIILVAFIWFSDITDIISLIAILMGVIK